MQMLKLK